MNLPLTSSTAQQSVVNKRDRLKTITVDVLSGVAEAGCVRASHPKCVPCDIWRSMCLLAIKRLLCMHIKRSRTIMAPAHIIVYLGGLDRLPTFWTSSPLPRGRGGRSYR